MPPAKLFTPFSTPPYLRSRHLKVCANLAREEVLHLAAAWNRRRLPAESDGPLNGETFITRTFLSLFCLFSIRYRNRPPNPRTPSYILKVGQAARTLGPLSPSSGATMSTLRQIEANRRNAQKSTGPTSVTGKATSSMNALKTGIHAESLVLPSENLADLEELTAGFYYHHQPATPDTRALVDELIYCEWMLRRLRVAETQAWQYQSDNKYSDPQKSPLGQSATCHSTTFSKLQYRLDATRRARLRALDALQKLKAEPGPAPEVEPPPPAHNPPPPPPPPPPPRPRCPPKTQGRTRPRPGSRTPNPGNRSPLSNPLAPNHFTPNWLRSVNPLRHPSPAGARCPQPQSQSPGTSRHPLPSDPLDQ